MENLYQKLFPEDEYSQIERKARDKLRRRQDFLIALDKIIGTDILSDFSKINLDDIAKHAGYTKPTFYRYFDNKEDFLLGFGAYAYRRITEIISKQIDEQANLENSSDLLVMVLTYHQIMKTHPGYIKILNMQGRQNMILTIETKNAANKDELSQSEKDYLLEWRRFRRLLERLPALTQADSILKKYPKFTISDIAEIFALIFNGIITEFDQRNKALQERGIGNQEILSFIVNLLEQGLQNI